MARQGNDKNLVWIVSGEGLTDIYLEKTVFVPEMIPRNAFGARMLVWNVSEFANTHHAQNNLVYRKYRILN